jgi:hypothetical protein
LLVGFGTYLYHNTLQIMRPRWRRWGTSVALFALPFRRQAIVTLAGYAFDHPGMARCWHPRSPAAGFARAAQSRRHHRTYSRAK